MFYKNGFIYFESKKYFLANDLDGFDTAIKIDLDAVILSGKSIRNLSAITNHFSFKELIIDSSVPKWLSKKIMKESVRENIECYSVSEKGAYVKKFM